jgi:hypothetical protein
VGPITAQYKGAARIVEADESAHKVVLKAEGRDTRGQGNASATVTATLTPEGSGTTVHIDTDLNITGKVAQFGRGVMADVSSKLLGQFAGNLERDVLRGNGAAAEPSPLPKPRPRHRCTGDAHRFVGGAAGIARRGDAASIRPNLAVDLWTRPATQWRSESSGRWWCSSRC